MRYLFVFSVVFLLGVGAQAQDVVLKSGCNPVVVSTDVQGAEYTPGVDVRGKSVVGADLGNDIKFLAYPVVIPVEIDIIRFLDLTIPAAVENATEITPDVAYFTMYEDGKIEYNGQDISNMVTHECVEEGDDPRVSVNSEALLSNEQVKTQTRLDTPAENKKAEKPVQDHGQDASDSVISGEKIEGQSP